MTQPIYALLDFNACVMHSYNSGTDPDAMLIEGKNVNTAGYGLQIFIERYFLNVASYVPLNHIIVVHDDLLRDKDGKYTDYRTLYYPDYKKARRMGKYSGEAKALCKAFLTAMGVPQVSLANVEADDVIAYLSMGLPGHKHVYSVDADLIALAQYEGVSVFQKLELKSDYKGIPPHLITLYKSLVGDTSDGYGGVRNFGPAKWDEFDIKQLEFFDLVVRTKAWDKLNIAYERSPTKSLKLLIDGKNEWVMAYHILAKMHPEFVDSKPTETFYIDEAGEQQPVPSKHFNRLKWVKKVPSRDALLAVLNGCGTNYLIDKLAKFLPTQTLITPGNLDVEKIKRQINNSRYVSLDWETWQVPNENFKKANQGKEFVDMLGSTIAGMGLTLGENLEHTYYLQFDHADTENNLDKQVLLDLLGYIPATMPVVCFNSYFETSVLIAEFGASLPIMYDPMVMHKHIDELADEHGLKSLSKRYLGAEQLHYEDVIEKGKTMQDYSGQHVFQYGADDPLVTAHLYDLFYIILNLEKTWEFVRDCEFPTVQLLAESYVEGVSFDLEAVEQQRSEDQAVYDTCIARMRELLGTNRIPMSDLKRHAATLYLADINPKGSEDDEEVLALADQFVYEEYREVPPEGKQKLSRWVGTELNLDSPKQMQYLFYGTLGLPIRIRDFKISETRKKKNLEGTPQVNTDAIDEAIFNGDAVGWKREVLECFSKAKKCATRVKLFYAKYPLWVHPKDGNVHPRFNSTGTESRRPTGGSPNLLQMSKKGDGVKVRRAIVPNRNKGHDLIVAIDFDGEELRVLGGLSGDKNLLSCYVGDHLRDAHAIVAAQIMGCEYEEFVANRKSSDKAVAKKHDDIRKVAKQVGFASAYGCGVNKLSRIIKEDLETTEKYLNAKKTVYSRLEDWKVEVKEELQEKGRVVTQLGCYRHAFDHYTKSNSDIKSYYERSAVNYLVQGLCAEYLKLVLSNLYKSKVFQRHSAVLLAPIYDEVVISVHSSQAISLIKEVYAAMTVGIPGVPVPMLANPSLGVNFGDQIEVLDDCNQVLTDELIQIAIEKALAN